MLDVSFTDNRPVKIYLLFKGSSYLSVQCLKYVLLHSPDYFYIVIFRVDSGLFHCIAVQDSGYADC